MKKILVGLFAFCCMMSGSAQRFFPVHEKATATKPVLSTSVSDKQAQVYPFVFIENAGQVLDVDQNFHPEVKYMYSKDYNAMYFEKNRIVCVFAVKDTYDEAAYAGNQDAKDSIYRTLGMQTQRIDIEFVGASENCTLIPGEKGNTVYNYFLYKRENISNVAVFNSVTYKNVYPQTDVVFYSYEGGIKYDIILHPGARIEDVKIRYHGAGSLRLENNTVNIETALYNFSEELPLAYFNDDRNLKADVQYTVDGDVIQYSCAYTNTDKLTIDPTLTWATYFETSGAAGTIDYDHNVTDAAGNLFFSGYCNNSANTYPTVSPGGTAYVQVWTSNDLYIAKFDPNRSLVWATYFGGSNSSMDWALGTEVMAVSGNVLHIVGDELATNAPFLNGGGFYYNAGSARPYYLRFDKTSGQLLHCTNISGGYHPSIAVSQSGLVAIMLHAYDFNTVHVVNRAGAYNQATNGGFTDLFLMLLNSSYTQIWGTFLGGPGTQENGHVAFDSNDNIFFSSEVQWMSGSTAANEHLVNPAGGAYYQTTYSGEDIMFGKFTSAGALYWNTLYGGNGNDGLDDEMGNGTKVIVNPANELLVIGGTSSTDFPLLTLAGAYNQTCPANINTGGSYDDFASFILKFSNTGVRQWSTYWGENSATSWALLYDGKFTSCNQFVVAARAVYTPVSFPGYYNKPTGGQSFLMLFNSSYATEWSSYVGDNTSTPQICYTPFENRLYLTTNTYASQVTVDPGGGAYYDGVKTGSSSYSIWEFNMVPAPTLTGTDTLCAGTTTTWTASVSGGTWSSSNTGVATINPATGFINAVADGTTTITYSSTVSGCPVTATEQLTVANVSVTASAASPSICSGSSTTVSASGATTYSWSPTGSGSSFTASPSSTTTYSVTGTSGSCTNSATVTVTVNATPTVTASATQTSICSGASTTISAGGAASYSWSPTGSGSSFSASPASTTTYSVTGTSSGCTNSASVTVTVNTVTDAAMNPAGPFCTSDAATTLTAVNAGGTWAGTGITNTSNGTFNPGVAGVGTHEITYTTTGTCPDTDTMNIVVSSVLDATITPAGPFCISGSAVTLTAATAGGTWSGTGITNASAGTFDPATAGVGTHEIIYTTSGACGDIDTAQISVVSQLDATITAAGPYCENDAAVVLSAANAGGTWSGTGITNAATGAFDPAVAGNGTYEIIYTIAGSCGDADSVDIVINDSPDFTYVATDESCTGALDGNIALTVTGGVNPLTYNWSTGANTASVAGIGEGSYTVTVTDANGCTRNAAITLGDPGVPCDDIIPHAVVPNAFSPNGDGENDVLYVRGEGVTQLSFIVYDRWGEKVFSTTTLNNGWDGTFRGKELDPAVFTYYLHAIFIDGSDKIEKGDVTLTR